MTCGGIGQWRPKGFDRLGKTWQDPGAWLHGCIIAWCDFLIGTPLDEGFDLSKLYGGFQKEGYPKMDALQWKTLSKWMIWGYPYFRKQSYRTVVFMFNWFSSLKFLHVCGHAKKVVHGNLPRTTYSFQLVQIHLINCYLLTYNLPSRELTYPIPKMAFWRWFSFPPGGIC